LPAPTAHHNSGAADTVCGADDRSSVSVATVTAANQAIRLLAVVVVNCKVLFTRTRQLAVEYAAVGLCFG